MPNDVGKVRTLFTIEQRDAVRRRVLGLAENDDRVVAAAVVGSLAVGAADRFSDLDLTFGVAGDVARVLDDFTRQLVEEFAAVHLVDLQREPTTYRVLLLRDALQLDLSMTPAASFRPAGPRFQLMFGNAAASDVPAPRSGGLSIPTPAVPRDIFGWGVIYALHARACIERGRLWQAEHYVGAVRDHALSLACLREDVSVQQARGYDDLSDETLVRFDGAHIGTLEPDALRSALAVCVAAMLDEAALAGIPHAATIAQRLAALHTQ